MYDLNKRVELSSPAVKDVLDSLMKLPTDMKVHFNGVDSGFLHVDSENNCCSFDDSELAEEYGKQFTK